MLWHGINSMLYKHVYIYSEIVTIFIAKSLAEYRSDWKIEPLVWPSTALRKPCPCYDGLLILNWLAVYFEWEIIGTRYFSFHGTSNPRSWYEAQADCQKGGGILASIHSGDEVTALVQFLSDRFVKLWSWFCGHDCNPNFLVKSDIFTLSFTHTHTHTHTHLPAQCTQHTQPFSIPIWSSWTLFAVRSWMSYIKRKMWNVNTNPCIFTYIFFCKILCAQLADTKPQLNSAKRKPYA